MKQKFAATDFNGDSSLDKAEFEAFQFPRYNKKVLFLWHKEMFLHFDKDRDGKITFNEYLEYQGLNESEMEAQQLQVKIFHNYNCNWGKNNNYNYFIVNI